MQRYDIPYVALNPGSTFRGLHDSIVNYGANRPEIILCQHEKIAVNIAHGYAKATGRPMGADRPRHRRAAARDQRDLLRLPRPRARHRHGRDRARWTRSRRRPNIDWIHTTVLQGDVVRDYVKWDRQPVGDRRRDRLLRPRLSRCDAGARGAGLPLLRRCLPGRPTRGRVRAARPGRTGPGSRIHADPAGHRPARRLAARRRDSP